MVEGNIHTEQEPENNDDDYYKNFGSNMEYMRYYQVELDKKKVAEETEEEVPKDWDKDNKKEVEVESVHRKLVEKFVEAKVEAVL